MSRDEQANALTHRRQDRKDDGYRFAGSKSAALF